MSYIEEQRKLDRFNELGRLHSEALECGVPDHLIAGLTEYCVTGRPLGDFLTAVMENNLMEAFGRADHICADAMKEICMFVYNYAPAPCHGSPEKVRAWYEKKGAEAKA